jgi:hypothetical protein
LNGGIRRASNAVTERYEGLWRPKAGHFSNRNFNCSTVGAILGSRRLQEALSFKPQIIAENRKRIAERSSRYFMMEKQSCCRYVAASARRPRSGINSPEQGADGIEHLADAIAVIHHLIQNFPHLPEVKRLAASAFCWLSGTLILAYIQLLGGRANGNGGGCGGWCVAEMRMKLFELPDLAERAPAKIAAPRLPQICGPGRARPSDR